MSEEYEEIIFNMCKIFHHLVNEQEWNDEIFRDYAEEILLLFDYGDC